MSDKESNKIKHRVIAVASLLFLLPLSGCSLDASIQNGSTLIEKIIDSNRENPDYINGEMVTTVGGTPGYQVNAVFGEISEKTSSLNGNNWQVEGVFYE